MHPIIYLQYPIQSVSTLCYPTPFYTVLYPILAWLILPSSQPTLYVVQTYPNSLPSPSTTKYLIPSLTPNPPHHIINSFALDSSFDSSSNARPNPAPVTLTDSLKPAPAYAR